MRAAAWSPPPITRLQREAHAGWQSPYAANPNCDHDGRCVEVTRDVPNPQPLNPYYLHIYLREWACEECGCPVNPHSYENYARISNQEDRRASNQTPSRIKK